MNPAVAKLLEEKRSQIEEVCRKYAVRRLALFGSGIGASWSPETSDLDFLVVYGPRPAGVSALSQLEGLPIDLSLVLGRKVDTVDQSSVRNPYFKEFAEPAAMEIYAA